MQRWRHSHDLIVHPAVVSVTCRQPLAARELSRDDIWFLLRWTLNEKEPRIKTSCVERRRHPATDVSKIVSIEVQLVMLQQCRPRDPSSFKIVEQRSSLTFRERVAAANSEHT